MNHQIALFDSIRMDTYININLIYVVKYNTFIKYYVNLTNLKNDGFVFFEESRVHDELRPICIKLNHANLEAYKLYNNITVDTRI